jgi:anti-anti-sigma factor
MFSIQVTKHGGQVRLKLVGELTIYTVRQAQQELLAQLAKHPSLELDLSGIDEFDTAGVQLLYWLRRTASARGAQIPLLHHSPAVVEVLDLLDLTAYFGDPILLSPSAS